MNLFLPPAEPGRALSELTTPELLRATLRAKIRELRQVVTQHEERIEVDTASIARHSLMRDRVLDEVAGWEGLLARLPDDESCSLCPPDGGCQYACGRP